MKEECSLSVFRIGHLFHLGIPAGTAFLARISLFGGRTLECGRISDTRPHGAGNLFGCPPDHGGGHSNRQIGREGISLSEKLFQDRCLAGGQPEIDSRQIFRDLHDLGKMFQALDISRIMPSEIGNFFALAGKQFRHSSRPQGIGKAFQPTLQRLADTRQNVHTLESVARAAR